MPDLLGRFIVGQVIAGPDLALRVPSQALYRCLVREVGPASTLRIPDQNSLTLIVSWLDLVERFTLELSMVIYQSNLSN